MDETTIIEVHFNNRAYNISETRMALNLHLQTLMHIYNMILNKSGQWQMQKTDQDFELTKDIPYLTREGEV